MAAIFGRFLKSWEGKFSFQIEDTLSASIPCLLLPIYLAMPQNRETGRREQGGEDVPRARWSLLKTSDAPRTISKRKGIRYRQRSGGKGTRRRALNIGNKRPRARGRKAQRVAADPEDSRAGAGRFDARWPRGNGLVGVEHKLRFRLVTGGLQSALGFLLREGSRRQLARRLYFCFGKQPPG